MLRPTARGLSESAVKFALLSSNDKTGTGEPGITISRKTISIAAEPEISDNGLPQKLYVSCSPNPFNSAIRIDWELPSECVPKLAILDILGRTIKNIPCGLSPAGSYTTVWDGTGESGKSVSSGIYFIRLSNSGNACIQKISLIK
jgi:hypothetical protein